jgi:hypothetical protein
MTHPPKSVIHINFMPNALRFEPRRVWTALRKAEELGKLTTTQRVAIESQLGRTAIHMASRDCVITVAVTALKTALQRLARLVPESISEKNRDGNKSRVMYSKALESKEIECSSLWILSFSNFARTLMYRKNKNPFSARPPRQAEHSCWHHDDKPPKTCGGLKDSTKLDPTGIEGQGRVPTGSSLQSKVKNDSPQRHDSVMTPFRKQP